MILISVFKLTDVKLAKLVARLSGCKLYRSTPKVLQFESPTTNITSARSLINFFRKQGYQVSRQKLYP